MFSTWIAPSRDVGFAICGMRKGVKKTANQQETCKMRRPKQRIVFGFSLSREKSLSSLFLSASSMEPYVTSAMGAPMSRPSMTPRTSPKQLPAASTQRLTRSCIAESVRSIDIDESCQKSESNGKKFLNTSMNQSFRSCLCHFLCWKAQN